MADNDKKFLDEDGVSQFAEETKKYIDKHADNADIHVTADDKAKIADVVNKANDADVVHKTGDETIDGNKTFTGTTSGTLFSGNFECNNKTSYYGTDYFYALSINDGKAHITNITDDKENRLIVSVLSDNEKAGNVFTLSIPRDTATASDTSGFYIQWIGKLRNNVTPERDSAFSLGLPDFRWETLYVNSINGKAIAYASDIPDVSGLAVDSNVVHKTGDEIVAGVKTFTSSMTIDGSGNQYQSYASDYVKGRTPSAIMYQGLRFYDDQKISTVSNHITGAFEIQYNTDGYNKAYIGCRNYAGTTQHNYNVGLRVPNDATRSIDFYPSADNKINLGTSSYRWADTNTVLLNGKTPAYADDLSPYAIDADVVHTKGAEEIAGTKTFTGTVVHKDSTQKLKMENTYIDYDVPLTATRTSSVEFYDKNNKNMARLIMQRETSGRNSFGLTTYNRNDSGTELTRKVALYLEKDYSSYFSPNVNNQVDLGHSSYHWKNIYVNSVNGKTPAYADDLSNYLPLSGGAMTNGVIGRNITNSQLSLRGGTTWNTGARLDLNGMDSGGDFLLVAYKPNVGAYGLAGKPTGELTWEGKSLDIIEEQGDGYIRYSNGLQICWENISLQNLVYNVGYLYVCNFPKSFVSAPSVTVNYSSAFSTDTGIAAEDIENVRCAIWLKNTVTGVANFNINYTAIGRWK